jgi:hypothetical protein
MKQPSTFKDSTRNSDVLRIENFHTFRKKATSHVSTAISQVHLKNVDLIATYNHGTAAG